MSIISTVTKPIENYIKSANILLTTHFVILKLRKIHPCFNFLCVWFCNWYTLPECLLKSGCERFNFNTYHLIPCMYQKIWNKIFILNPLCHIQATNLYQKFDYRSKSILHDLNQCKRPIYRYICFKLVVSIAILKFDASSSRYRNLNLISYQHTFFNQSKQCFIHLNISPAAAMTD